MGGGEEILSAVALPALLRLPQAYVGLGESGYIMSKSELIL